MKPVRFLIIFIHHGPFLLSRLFLVGNVSSQVSANSTLFAEYLAYHFVRGNFQNVSSSYGQPCKLQNSNNFLPPYIITYFFFFSNQLRRLHQLHHRQLNHRQLPNHQRVKHLQQHLQPQLPYSDVFSVVETIVARIHRRLN